MKYLLIMFVALTILFFFFGKINMKGTDISTQLYLAHSSILTKIFFKLLAGLVFSFAFTMLFGLPMLGLISLLF